MAGPSLVSAATLLAEIGSQVGTRLAERRQSLRVDADPALWLEVEDAARRLLVELVGVASQSAPPECELLLAAARGPARVTAVGTGEIVVRWQLALADAPSREPHRVVVPLRPARRTAQAWIRSRESQRLLERFRRAGWQLALDAVGSEQEIRARASRAPG